MLGVSHDECALHKRWQKEELERYELRDDEEGDLPKLQINSTVVAGILLRLSGLITAQCTCSKDAAAE